MKLYTLHRILILFSIALGLVLLVWGLSRWRSTGEVIPMVTGVAGAAVGVGLGFYLRWFVRTKTTP